MVAVIVLEDTERKTETWGCFRVSFESSEGRGSYVEELLTEH